MKRFILILILLIFIGAGFFIFLRPEPKKTVSAPKETTPTSTSVQTYVKENYTAKKRFNCGLQKRARTALFSREHRTLYGIFGRSE